MPISNARILQTGTTGSPSLQTQTLTVSSAVLADQSSADLAIALGKAWILFSVETNAKSRVRLYRSAWARTADAGRLFGTLPNGEHGLLLDLIPPATNLLWHLSPIVVGANADSPRANSAYLAVQNLSGIEQPITLTFFYLVLEV